MAAYEVLLLNTAIPQIQAAQTGDTYVVPRAIAFNSGVNVVNNDVTIYGLTVGRGAGAVSDNTAVGASALTANTTGARNSSFGWRSLYSNTTGTDNTALGTAALYTNTAGSTNTAIGRDSLPLNTTGSSNTAIGLEALRSNTTASNNTAVGYQAGYSNTTGRVDALGQEAGFSNTTGSITAIGRSAGYSNTTGVGNIAVSNTFNFAPALYSNTTGSYNVAIGEAALSSNTTASANTAIGQQALQANTTGASNTAVGYHAGYSNTTGANNAFFGVTAGYSITTGGFNSFMGQGSGELITTGSKNTILGRYNGNQGGLDIRTLSNRIVLSDGDGNPRGVFDNNGKFTVDAGFITTAGAVSGGVSFTGSCNGDLGTIGLQIANTSNNVGAKAIRFLGWDGSETGSVTTNVNNTTYNTSSDYRLKNITGPITNSGSYIDSLKPVEGTWKHDGSVFVGLVAHEAQEVSRTQIATGSKDGDEMQGMSYSSPEMIANLIAEVQSLRARVAALESI